MSNFWKKTFAGAAIGLAFGVLGALGFIGTTRVIKAVFPEKTEAVKVEEKDADTAAEDKKEITVRESAKEEKVGNASLTKAVDDGTI